MIRLATFALAAGLAAGAALVAAQTIEARAEREAARALAAEGLGFARAEADGLRLVLSGTAPTEAQRFRALAAAGRAVGPARVEDAMEVARAAEVAPPRYAVEMLRGEDGLSLIGLVPEGTDREAVARRLREATGEEVLDFLETAADPVPDAWPGAFRYALAAAAALPRSKISVDAERVAVAVAAESPEDRRRIEADLARTRPAGLELALDVSAPRPVIAPFTLRFEAGAEPRLTACAAASPEGAARIEAAAREAGVAEPSCRLGLGAPSPRWPEAAVLAIEAAADLGGGAVTVADADLTLVAPGDAAPRRFDSVAGALEGALPPAFSLHAVPPAEAAPTEAPEFTAELSEGRVALGGRLPHERAREAALSLARARFPGAAIDVATRTAEGLPRGWPLRAMAGIEALALLKEGEVAVDEDGVTLRGVAGERDAEARAAGLLSRALGGGEDMRIDVAYDPALDAEAAGPAPAACLARIEAVQKERKITFAPGSDGIEPSGLAALEEIAGVLRECPAMALEVAGHTDSQGREGMNLELSRARAEAVVAALSARRAPVAGLRPVGYGESSPVAGNDTAEGRESNRRIEFVLLDEGPEPDPRLVHRARTPDPTRVAPKAAREPAAAERPARRGPTGGRAAEPPPARPER